MKHNINRRKFLELFGFICCGLILPSCTTVPITERKQLSFMSESRINAAASRAYENFRNKTKLITKGRQLDQVILVGKKLKKLYLLFLKVKIRKTLL